MHEALQLGAMGSTRAWRGQRICSRTTLLLRLKFKPLGPRYLEACNTGMPWPRSARRLLVVTSAGLPNDWVAKDLAGDDAGNLGLET